jgi:hypothetical protein
LEAGRSQHEPPPGIHDLGLGQEVQAVQKRKDYGFREGLEKK